MHSFLFRLQTYQRLNLIILVFLCLNICIGLGCSQKRESTKELKVGLLEEPKTLNIWLANDSWSNRVLSLIYQPLYMRHPETLKFLPWLAESDPVYHASSLSYTVKLRDTVWSDGSPLTSEDVAFTAGIIREFKIPRHYAKWAFVKKIETPDERTVRFYLEKSQAIFVTRTLTTPIVQKREWKDIVDQTKGSEHPLNALLNYKIDMPVSNGPFILQEWKKGAYLHLMPNDSFFGKGKQIGDRLLGPFLDGLIFKIYGTSDAAILALKKGTIDMYWWGIQPGYVEDLEKAENIRLFASEKSALYYLGFNVRKPPLNDVHFRRAITTLIDKDFIVERLLQGKGLKMHTVVPPGNRFWLYTEVPTYGDGLSRNDRILQAHRILKKAGYGWETPPVNDNGEIVEGKGIKTSEGEKINTMTILTPPADYDPQRAMTGMMIQEWLRTIGIPATAKPMAFSSLMEQVQVRREFDAFVLAYGNLSLDPDYVRRFFHSREDKIRGRNTSGYSNPEFDRISDKSAGEMDKEVRRQLLWQMQQIITRDVPWIPLYNPNIIEAVRSDRFSGWVQMMGGIGNPWSFCVLKPIF